VCLLAMHVKRAWPDGGHTVAKLGEFRITLKQCSYEAIGDFTVLVEENDKSHAPDALALLDAAVLCMGDSCVLTHRQVANPI
jgi:hypothetical protein